MVGCWIDRSETKALPQYLRLSFHGAVNSIIERKEVVAESLYKCRPHEALHHKECIVPQRLAHLLKAFRQT